MLLTRARNTAGMRQIFASATPTLTLSVARAIHDASRRRGAGLNVLQLEKLIYLSHGWSLACTNKPLVEEVFHVGETGPVLASFGVMKRTYGSDTLPTTDGDRIFGGDCVPFGDDIVQFEVIARTVAKYGHFMTWKLSAITRMDGGAYERALGAGVTHLSDDEIRADFIALGKAGRQSTEVDAAA